MKTKKNIWKAIIKIAILTAGLVGGVVAEKTDKVIPVVNEIVELL